MNHEYAPSRARSAGETSELQSVPARRTAELLSWEEKPREEEKHETEPHATTEKGDDRHAVEIPEEVQPTGVLEETTPTASNPVMSFTCKNSRAASGLKSNVAPVQFLGCCPLVLGSVARQFGGWSPLREVPACGSRPWFLHSHNATGTCIGRLVYQVVPTLSQWVPAPQLPR